MANIFIALYHTRGRYNRIHSKQFAQQHRQPLCVQLSVQEIPGPTCTKPQYEFDQTVPFSGDSGNETFPDSLHESLARETRTRH